MRKIRVERANGEIFSFADTVKKIVKTQDMESWLKEDPRGFNTWMQNTISDIVKRMDYLIVE